MHQFIISHKMIRQKHNTMEKAFILLIHSISHCSVNTVRVGIRPTHTEVHQMQPFNPKQHSHWDELTQWQNTRFCSTPENICWRTTLQNNVEEERWRRTLTKSAWFNRLTPNRSQLCHSRQRLSCGKCSTFHSIDVLVMPTVAWII